MDLLYSIAGFIIAIGILVTFHEFGHFIVARYFDVKVLKFSVGFGKSIYMRKSKDTGTEYSVCTIPLGGYVQMLESKNREEGDVPVPENDLPHCFDKKNVYQRFAIVAAGPIFNLILAIIFFTLTYINGISGIKPSIKVDGNTFTVVNVNQKDVTRWQDVRVEILNNIMESKKLILGLEGDGGSNKNLILQYPNDILNKEGDIVQNLNIDIVYPNNEPIIGSISHSDNNKNILEGDEILSINNQNVNTWTDLVTIVKNNPNRTVEIIAKRSDAIVNYNVHIGSKSGSGFLGVGNLINKDNIVRVNYGFFESFTKGLEHTVDYTILTFKMIGRLVTGQANVKNLSGPIAIAEFSGKSLEMGLSYFLYLMAILSVSLGVLNLLPIPMLDGGHLVYYTYEIVAGKEISERFQIAAQTLGIVILGSIMIIAFYNDLIRLFS